MLSVYYMSNISAEHAHAKYDCYHTEADIFKTTHPNLRRLVEMVISTDPMPTITFWEYKPNWKVYNNIVSCCNGLQPHKKCACTNKQFYLVFKCVLSEMFLVDRPVGALY